MSTVSHGVIRKGRNGSVSEDRCREPVAQCLVRHLMLPMIYFERKWPPGSNTCPDIVAVDRAGTGEVHVVEIKRTLSTALNAGAKSVFGLPAHYRWVAFQGEGLTPTDDEAEISLLSEEPLLPKTGMGRIGVIEVIRMPFGDLEARIRLKAERFRPGDISAAIDDFQKREKPDIEFKE